ncbi:hypothetical protein Tco_1294309 [Tanacetum coccineum]
MMSKYSKAGLVSMFDMHVHVSTLTLKELEDDIKTYGVTRYLHPRLPDPELTMDSLPTDRHRHRHILSLFRVFYKLCKQGHWFSFENKTGKRAKKCFKEITSSLLCWKKKFFLIDRRAIPDVMAWRHRDTDVSDDFPIRYNEDHANLVAEKIIPLRKPPQSLLFMAGLTTVYRHPDLSQILLDSEGRGNSFSLSITIEGQEITMDDFLCRPNWTRIVVSKGDPLPEDQRPPKRTVDPLPFNAAIPAKTSLQQNIKKPDPKITKDREKKEQQYFLKAKSKRVNEEGVDGPKKKKKEGGSETATKDVEIPVMDLSEPTREKTPQQDETMHGETSAGHADSQPANERHSDGGCRITSRYVLTMLLDSSFPILQLWLRMKF